MKVYNSVTILTMLVLGMRWSASLLRKQWRLNPPSTLGQTVEPDRDRLIEAHGSIHSRGNVAYCNLLYGIALRVVFVLSDRESCANVAGVEGGSPLYCRGRCAIHLFTEDPRLIHFHHRYRNGCRWSPQAAS